MTMPSCIALFIASPTLPDFGDSQANPRTHDPRKSGMDAITCKAGTVADSRADQVAIPTTNRTSHAAIDRGSARLVGRTHGQQRLASRIFCRQIRRFKPWNESGLSISPLRIPEMPLLYILNASNRGAETQGNRNCPSKQSLRTLSWQHGKRRPAVPAPSISLTV